MAYWKKNPFAYGRKRRPRKAKKLNTLGTKKEENQHQEKVIQGILERYKPILGKRIPIIKIRDILSVKENTSETNVSNNNNIKLCERINIKTDGDVDDIPLYLRLEKQIKREMLEYDALIAQKCNVTLKDVKVVLNDIGPFIKPEGGFYNVHGHQALENNVSYGKISQTSPLIKKEERIPKEESNKCDEVVNLHVNTVKPVRNVLHKDYPKLENYDTIQSPAETSSTKPLADASFEKKHTPDRLINQYHFQPATSSKAAKDVVIKKSLPPKESKIKQQDSANRVKRLKENKGRSNRASGKKTFDTVEKSPKSSSGCSLETNKCYNYRNQENDTNTWRLPNIIASLNSYGESYVPRKPNIKVNAFRKRNLNNHRLTERNASVAKVQAQTHNEAFVNNATNVNGGIRLPNIRDVKEKTELQRILPKIVECHILNEGTAEKKDTVNQNKRKRSSSESSSSNSSSSSSSGSSGSSSSSSTSSSNSSVTSRHSERNRPPEVEVERVTNVTTECNNRIQLPPECTATRIETQQDVRNNKNLANDTEGTCYTGPTNTRQHQEEHKDTFNSSEHKVDVNRKVAEIAGKVFTSLNRLKSYATDCRKATQYANAMNYDKTQEKSCIEPIQFLNSGTDLRTKINNKRIRLSEKFAKTNVTNENTKNLDSILHSPIRSTENTTSVSSHFSNTTRLLKLKRKPEETNNNESGLASKAIKFDRKIQYVNCENRNNERIANRHSQEILSRSESKISLLSKQSKNSEIITNEKVNSVKNMLYKSGSSDSVKESQSKIIKSSVEEEEKSKTLNEEKVLFENSSQIREKSPDVESNNSTILRKENDSEVAETNSTLNSKIANHTQSSFATGDYSDDDCISLFADSYRDLEDEDGLATLSIEQQDDSYSIKSAESAGSYYERYTEHQKDEFNKAYEQNLESNQATQVSERKNHRLFDVDKLPRSTQIANRMVQQNIYRPENVGHTRYFNGYCFQSLRFGQCHRHTCTFRHQIEELIVQLNNAGLSEFIRSFDDALLSRFFFFAKRIYKQSIRNMHPDLIFKLFLRLYEKTSVDQTITVRTVETLISKNCTVQQIIDQIKPYVHLCNINFAAMFMSLKEYIPRGELWNTMKDIFWRLTDPNIQILQSIISECVDYRPEHANDILQFLLARVDNALNLTLDVNLMIRFRNCLPDSFAKDINNTVRQARIGNTGSRFPNKLPQLLDSTAATCSPSGQSSQNDPNNNNEKNFERSQCLPTKSNDCQAEKSFPCTGTAEDIYHNLSILQQGLARRDYHHALSAVENVPNIEPVSLIPQLYYQTVFKDQMLSTTHLNNLFSLTALKNVKNRTRDILRDIAENQLADLVDEGLYVFAKSLLKNLMSFKRELNASEITLHAEIYLANQEPIKAFNLLKRYNIVSTNRDKWTVPSTEEDEKTRVTLLTILLDALSVTNPEYALNLFQKLIVEQSSNYSPVDLTRSIDKMVSVILLTKDSEMVTNVGKTLCTYNIPLRSITYRALIATLVLTDPPLAAQIYRHALGLRVYSLPKFHPVTHLVVNTVWSKEEMFFIFEDFFRKIMLNIGHGIDHVRSQNLSVYMILENVSPLEKMYENKEYNRMDKNELKHCEITVREVLMTFNPSIKLIKKSAKILKIQSTTLLSYFKAIFNG